MRRHLVVLLALPLLACSDGGDDAEVARLQRSVRELQAEPHAAHVTTTLTTRPAQQCFPTGPAFCPTDLNTTTTLPGRLGAAQVLFTELVRTYCDAAPNPLTATFALDGDQVRVTDGNGDQLLVDTEHRKVTPIDGPDGIIPQAYRSCSTHVFLGYADH